MRYGNLIPKKVVIGKMIKTQIASLAVLSFLVNSIGSGEFNDVLLKASA